MGEGILIEEAFPEDDQIILMNPAHDICDEFLYDQNSDNYDINQQVNKNECDYLSEDIRVNPKNESHKSLENEILCVTDAIGNTKVE